MTFWAMLLMRIVTTRNPVLCKRTDLTCSIDLRLGMFVEGKSFVPRRGRWTKVELESEPKTLEGEESCNKRLVPGRGARYCAVLILAIILAVLAPLLIPLIVILVILSFLLGMVACGLL